MSDISDMEEMLRAAQQQFRGHIDIAADLALKKLLEIGCQDAPKDHKDYAKILSVQTTALTTVVNAKLKYVGIEAGDDPLKKAIWTELQNAYIAAAPVISRRQETLPAGTVVDAPPAEEQ